MPSNQTRKLLRRQTQRPNGDGWRATAYDIIFEADTPSGRWFDILLLLVILASITIVSLETVPEFQRKPSLMYKFTVIEWILTGLFTIEYLLRLSCVRRPLRYAISFWGIIDLLSILPTYVTHFLDIGSRSFVILRSIRLLRVFRVLKLWRMMDEADELSMAVWKSRNKIIVFLMVVLVAVTISGTLMYHVEAIVAGGRIEYGPNSRSLFTSIPESMYWAIITMTTVGYGDVVPRSAIGKAISAALVLLGYSLIIVPSTFIGAEMIKEAKPAESDYTCSQCNETGHRQSAEFCFRCGARF